MAIIISLTSVITLIALTASWLSLTHSAGVLSADFDEASSEVDNINEDVPNCPCVPRDMCPRLYGQSAVDVRELGFLGPCLEYGTVRCCGVAVSVERNQGTGTAAPEWEKSAENSFDGAHPDELETGASSPKVSSAPIPIRSLLKNRRQQQQQQHQQQQQQQQHQLQQSKHAGPQLTFPANTPLESAQSPSEIGLFGELSAEQYNSSSPSEPADKPDAVAVDGENTQAEQVTGKPGARILTGGTRNINSYGIRRPALAPWKTTPRERPTTVKPIVLLKPSPPLDLSATKRKNLNLKPPPITVTEITKTTNLTLPPRVLPQMKRNMSLNVPNIRPFRRPGVALVPTSAPNNVTENDENTPTLSQTIITSVPLRIHENRQPFNRRPTRPTPQPSTSRPFIRRVPSSFGSESRTENLPVKEHVAENNDSQVAGADATAAATTHNATRPQRRRRPFTNTTAPTPVLVPTNDPKTSTGSTAEPEARPTSPILYRQPQLTGHRQQLFRPRVRTPPPLLPQDAPEEEPVNSLNAMEDHAFSATSSVQVIQQAPAGSLLPTDAQSEEGEYTTYDSNAGIPVMLTPEDPVELTATTTVAPKTTVTPIRYDRPNRLKVLPTKIHHPRPSSPPATVVTSVPVRTISQYSRIRSKNDEKSGGTQVPNKSISTSNSSTGYSGSRRFSIPSHIFQRISEPQVAPSETSSSIQTQRTKFRDPLSSYDEDNYDLVLDKEKRKYMRVPGVSPVHHKADSESLSFHREPESSSENQDPFNPSIPLILSPPPVMSQVPESSVVPPQSPVVDEDNEPGYYVFDKIITTSPEPFQEPMQEESRVHTVSVVRRRPSKESESQSSEQSGVYSGHAELNIASSTPITVTLASTEEPTTTSRPYRKRLRQRIRIPTTTTITPISPTTTTETTPQPPAIQTTVLTVTTETPLPSTENHNMHAYPAAEMNFQVHPSMETHQVHETYDEIYSQQSEIDSHEIEREEPAPPIPHTHFSIQYDKIEPSAPLGNYEVRPVTQPPSTTTQPYFQPEPQHVLNNSLLDTVQPQQPIAQPPSVLQYPVDHNTAGHTMTSRPETTSSSSFVFPPYRQPARAVSKPQPPPLPAQSSRQPLPPVPTSPSRSPPARAYPTRLPTPPPVASNLPQPSPPKVPSLLLRQPPPPVPLSSPQSPPVSNYYQTQSPPVSNYYQTQSPPVSNYPSQSPPVSNYPSQSPPVSNYPSQLPSVSNYQPQSPPVSNYPARSPPPTHVPAKFPPATSPPSQATVAHGVMTHSMPAAEVRPGVGQKRLPEDNNDHEGWIGSMESTIKDQLRESMNHNGQPAAFTLLERDRNRANVYSSASSKLNSRPYKDSNKRYQNSDATRHPSNSNVIRGQYESHGTLTERPDAILVTTPATITTASPITNNWNAPIPKTSVVIKVPENQTHQPLSSSYHQSAYTRPRNSTNFRFPVPQKFSYSWNNAGGVAPSPQESIPYSAQPPGETEKKNVYSRPDSGATSAATQAPKISIGNRIKLESNLRQPPFDVQRVPQPEAHNNQQQRIQQPDSHNYQANRPLNYIQAAEKPPVPAQNFYSNLNKNLIRLSGTSTAIPFVDLKISEQQVTKQAPLHFNRPQQNTVSPPRSLPTLSQGIQQTPGGFKGTSQSVDKVGEQLRSSQGQAGISLKSLSSTAPVNAPLQKAFEELGKPSGGEAEQGSPGFSISFTSLPDRSIVNHGPVPPNHYMTVTEKPKTHELVAVPKPLPTEPAPPQPSPSPLGSQLNSIQPNSQFGQYQQLGQIHSHYGQPQQPSRYPPAPFKQQSGESPNSSSYQRPIQNGLTPKRAPLPPQSKTPALQTRQPGELYGNDNNGFQQQRFPFQSFATTTSTTTAAPSFTQSLVNRIKSTIRFSRSSDVSGREEQEGATAESHGVEGDDVNDQPLSITVGSDMRMDENSEYQADSQDQTSHVEDSKLEKRDLDVVKEDKPSAKPQHDLGHKKKAKGGFKAPREIERGFLPVLPYSEPDPGPKFVKIPGYRIS